MTKIADIPKPELRSQSINAQNRQEFVVEFTRSVFMDRILAATPSDLGNWEQELNTQVHLLRDAFPLMKKEAEREVYGEQRSIYRVVNWPHNEYKNVAQRVDSYRFGQQLLNQDRLAEGVEGRAKAFSRDLQKAIMNKMPNVEACENRRKELIALTQKHSSDLTPEEHAEAFIWLPPNVHGIDSLLTEKKHQSPTTGAVTRTIIIRKQYTEVIPKAVQKRILAWIKRKQKEVSVEHMQQEMQLMYEFAQELIEGLRIIRNTKQFQERLPDMFDEFCFITGLGQADGKDLICHQNMGTVLTILAQTKK